jgi:hypothetical protein
MAEDRVAVKQGTQASQMGGGGGGSMSTGWESVLYCGVAWYRASGHAASDTSRRQRSLNQWSGSVGTTQRHPGSKGTAFGRQVGQYLGSVNIGSQGACQADQRVVLTSSNV